LNGAECKSRRSREKSFFFHFFYAIFYFARFFRLSTLSRPDEKVKYVLLSLELADDDIAAIQFEPEIIDDDKNVYSTAFFNNKF
jgi:hypothetical protein